MSLNDSTFDLKVSGLVPLTTADFPGKLSAVLFCQGCPWQCRYCHNPHLIPRHRKGLISTQILFDFLSRRQGLLDAVVFSGGEPTMQNHALLQMIMKVHDMGFQIAVHTAGTYPKVLQKILPFISWIGMDIKAPFGKYSIVTQRAEKKAIILQSIELILKSKIDYEFRTTIHSNLLSESDILDMAYDLSELGVKKYVLQQFRSEGCVDENLIRQFDFKRIPEPVLNQVAGMFETFEYRV